MQNSAQRCLHPAEKVIRIVGQRAHVAGGHVQQVRIEFGRVSNSAAQVRARFNEYDLQRTLGSPHKLNRDDCAARAPAYDRKRWPADSDRVIGG
jgi:hypothetical protein